MKKFEKILIIIAVIGLVLKLLNFPLSGLLLFLSLMLLSFVYYILGLAIVNNISPVKKVFTSDSYKGYKPIRFIASVALGWGLSILTVGILFDIQMYPLNNTFLRIGIVATLVSFFIIVFLFKKNILDEYLGILIRTVAIIIIAFILLLLPPYSLEKIQYRNYPDYLEAIKSLDKDPDNKDLINKFEEERSRMIRGDKK